MALRRWSCLYVGQSSAQDDSAETMPRQTNSVRERRVVMFLLSVLLGNLSAGSPKGSRTHCGSETDLVKDTGKAGLEHSKVRQREIVTVRMGVRNSRDSKAGNPGGEDPCGAVLDHERAAPVP